jgi:putative phosphoribosyl transferase
MQNEGFATLLFDLLTPREEANDRLTDAYSGNVPFLSSRLMAATDWATSQSDIGDLPVGYFAAGVGAAAALVAATRRESVQCIVSRGGRPDLAGDALADVTAATLFIMGGMDRQVLVANRGARERMRRAKTELSIIPGAGHLCEERGVLEEGARLAADWFRMHLGTPWVATR